MKRRYLILLLAAGLAAPSVSSQPAPDARVLQFIARQRQDAHVLSPDLILHQVREGERWPVQGQRAFTYQGRHRREAWTYVRDGEALYNDTRTTYEVPPGEAVVKRVETWDRQRAAFIPSHRYVNLYDTTHTALREGLLHQEWDGGAWTDRERTLYLFYAPPPTYILTVKGAITEAWDGAAWTPVTRRVPVESAFGVVELRHTWSGETWKPSERIEYPWHTIGSLYDQFARLKADLTDYGDLNLSLRYVPAQSRQVWDSNDEVHQERMAWEAMERPGEPAVIAQETWNGSAWVPEARQTLSYEPAGTSTRPASLRLEAYGNGWTTTITETYQYDGAGRLVKAEQQMDVGAGLEDYAWYTIRWKDVATATEDDETPNSYTLEAAYPNPFNPVTTLRYTLAVAGPVAIRVYDAMGRRVATLVEGVQPAGTHAISFRGDGLASGLYLVRLEAPQFRQTRTVTLAK